MNSLREASWVGRAHHEFPPQMRWLVLLTVLVGALFAFTTPAGLPYDEPAHWSNVLFFAAEHRLPVLGEPGVLYEGQQTPLYYVLAAPLSAVGGSAGFFTVRLFGVLGHVLLTILTAVILRQAVPSHPAVVWLGTAFIGLNPMLLVMGASVQNDTWALVFAFGAVALAGMNEGRRPFLRACAVGILGGLAVLTKLTMAPVIMAIALAYWFRRGFRKAVAIALAAIALTGWWFARNLALYGDLTGQSAVARTGAVFENVPVGPFYVARTILTYLTLPTEYLRNSIAAPSWVDALAVGLGAIVVAGGVRVAWAGRRTFDPWPFLLIALTGVTAVAAWLAEILLAWPVAFRTAYGVLPLIALYVGAVGGLDETPPWPKVGRAVGWVTVVALAVINFWVAWTLLTGGGLRGLLVP